MLRGHIRTSFENDELYHLVKRITVLDPSLKIYIHTWNKVSNSISWRKIEENNTCVHEEFVMNYFKDLKPYIQHIIIEDDTKIQLHGNLNGNVAKSGIPTKGWKNYWHGQYTLIDYIRNHNVGETILNCRFDVLENSNSCSIVEIETFLRNHIHQKVDQNIFMHKGNGVDNFFMGPFENMHKLVSEFYLYLDQILLKYPNTTNPEVLVYRIDQDLYHIN